MIYKCQKPIYYMYIQNLEINIMTNKIMNVEEIKEFIRKEWELKNHHHFLFAYAEECIMVLVDPHLICKETNRIEDDPAMNDTLQYWVEILVPFEINWADPSSEVSYKKGRKYAMAHDWELDCGGLTYEEAILKAHELIIKKYGPTSEAMYDKEMNRLISKR